jgi:hypothetical protein
MKFCYCDESGTGGEPFGVMAAILVDSQRMHVTKSEWNDLLEKLSGLAGRKINEFHTADFYPGNSPWRSLSGKQRTEIVNAIISWLDRRSHKIIVTSVDNEKFRQSRSGGPVFSEVRTPWVSMAFHTVLSVQKAMQGEKGVKGATVFVFDKKGEGEADLINLVKAPPGWSDSYYARKKEPALNCVIDVPHFVDSAHVPLVQVADLAAYLMRRFCEFQSGRITEKYEGERAYVEGCVEAIRPSMVQASAVYAAKGASPLAEFFSSHAAKPVIELYRR